MHPLEQKPAPAFLLTDQDGLQHSAELYRGQWIVLYFYPRDMTPGCTIEACAYRDSAKDLKDLGVIVLGVSTDTEASHKKFSAKYGLTFPLLVDEEGRVAKAYGSYGEKKFMGKRYQGILRNTYLINPQGVIEKVYEHVKPAKHVGELIKDLQNYTTATEAS